MLSSESSLVMVCFPFLTAVGLLTGGMGYTTLAVLIPLDHSRRKSTNILNAQLAIMWQSCTAVTLMIQIRYVAAVLTVFIEWLMSAIPRHSSSSPFFCTNSPTLLYTYTVCIVFILFVVCLPFCLLACLFPHVHFHHHIISCNPTLPIDII